MIYMPGLMQNPCKINYEHALPQLHMRSRHEVENEQKRQIFVL